MANETGRDTPNSISSDPLFTSTVDLHIPANSPLMNAGTDLSITEDFDGDTRPVVHLK